jgi:hypothetical protein
MWLDYIWNIPLFWWLLLTVTGAGIIIFVFLQRQKKADPIKKQMNHFCCCYARGEISRVDFEELIKDLNTFEKRITTTEKRKPTPRVKARENKKQPIR